MAKITPEDFLAALGFNIEEVGSLEIRLIGGPSGPEIYWKFNWPAIKAANENGANVYFGVAHRDGRGGKTNNITYATAVWADIDAKDLDPNDVDNGKELALDHLWKTVPQALTPSIVVDSGHGYHVYWLLKSPWAFSSDERRDEFKGLLERLAALLKGDRQVTDIARTLRLPGTMNTKDEERRLCEVIHWKPEARYNFSDLQAFAGSAAVDLSKQQVVKLQGHDFSRDLDIAIQSLQRLNPKRADDYETWIAVGMALHSISDDPDEASILLSLWDNWSRQSQKYKPGHCAEKWQSFSLDRGHLLTVDSLMKWANEDSGEKIIIPGGRHPKPSAILKALKDMGYTFRQNDMNDCVYVNSVPMSDGLRSRILVRLNENKYRNNTLAEHVWTAEAYENRFHPIHEYLSGLKWDGVSRIEKFSEYILDEDNLFVPLIRAWLIGAVNKIIGRKGQQHPMLVLDGAQGIGKSRFVWWLGSPLPQFFIASPINPDDKDFLIRQCSMFVWEVEELGSTFRRSDREALKAFISREIVNIRKPYGRFDIQKPVTASYIGTINNEGGFLTDPTGNRRFRIATITAIDWKYSSEIDVNQVWAEAVHLLNNNWTWELPKDVETLVSGKNQDYLAEDPIETIVWQLYEVTNNPFDRVRMVDILSDIKSLNVNIDLSTATGNRVGAILTRAGLRRRRTSMDGRGGVPVWEGIKPKTHVQTVNVDVKQLMESK